MKNLNAETVLWVVACGAWLAMGFSGLFHDDSPDPVPSPPPALRPRFIWGDWDLRGDDQLVLHFRVEGGLVWWLTVDDECPRLKHPTVMPKNFRPGQEGRIVMSFPGALDEPDDRPIEFGIRYCTTDGHIETQAFAWRIWRDPAPLARERVLVA